MNLKKQTDAILGIIVNPKKTLLALPSDEFYIVSFIISAFLIFSRLFPLKNPENLSVTEIITGLLPLIISFIALFFIISFILKIGARLFGRIITYRKAMNIIGYCQMPRVLFVVPVSFVALLFPAIREPNGFNRLLNLVALGLAIYSFALIIYGVKLSTRNKDYENS
jgi:hypothetical protein